MYWINYSFMLWWCNIQRKQDNNSFLGIHLIIEMFHSAFDPCLDAMLQCLLFFFFKSPLAYPGLFIKGTIVLSHNSFWFSYFYWAHLISPHPLPPPLRESGNNRSKIF